MADDDAVVNLHFTQDLDDVAPGLISGFERTIAQIKGSASETERLTLFGGLMDQIAEIAGALGNDVPEAIRKARAAAAGGVLAPGAITDVTGGLRDLISDLGKVQTAVESIGSGLDAKALTTVLLDPLAKALQLAAELKVDLKSLGVPGQQIGQITRAQNSAISQAQVRLGASPTELNARAARLARDSSGPDYQIVQAQRRWQHPPFESPQDHAESVRTNSQRALANGSPLVGDAKILLDAIKASGPAGRPLYKGVNGDWVNQLLDMAPGAQFTSGVASFTSDPKVASRFGNRGVVLETDENTKALRQPTGGFIPDGGSVEQNFDGEKESLVAGRFEILSKEFDQELNAVRMKIRAVGDQFGGDRKFDPDELGFRVQDEPGRNLRHISAHRAGGDPLDQLGHMVLDSNTGEIDQVFTHPAYRRQGVGSQIFQYAQQQGFNPQHSTTRTDEGDAWAQAVGGNLPPRVDPNTGTAAPPQPTGPRPGMKRGEPGSPDVAPAGMKYDSSGVLRRLNPSGSYAPLPAEQAAMVAAAAKMSDGLGGVMGAVAAHAAGVPAAAPPAAPPKPPPPPPPPTNGAGHPDDDDDDQINRLSQILHQGLGAVPGQGGSTPAPPITDEEDEENKRTARINRAHAAAQKAANEGTGSYQQGTLDDLVQMYQDGSALRVPGRKSKFGGDVYAAPGMAEDGSQGLFEVLPKTEENLAAIISHTIPTREGEQRAAESLTRTYSGLERVATTLTGTLERLTAVGAPTREKFGGWLHRSGGYNLRDDATRSHLGVGGEGNLTEEEAFERRHQRLLALNEPGGRLHGIETANPAPDDAPRQLGQKYVQVGDELRKIAAGAETDIRSIEELTQARELLAGVLKKEQEAGERAAAAAERQAQAAARSSRPSGGHGSDEPVGFIQGVLGGAGGHGFASQKFDLSKVPTNLGSTLGIVARYSAEYRVYQSILDSGKAVYEQTEQLNQAMVLLGNTMQATGVHQVNLNEAYDVGAKFGINEADSVKLGTEALKAYSEEIKGGANASDIFADSIKQAGVNALITGQDIQTANAQLTALTKQFNLGSGGKSTINDALLATANQFSGNPADIQQGVTASGDLANAGGFDVQRLMATVGAVNEDTGKQSGDQIARELGQGGSNRFRSALQQLGVTYNAGDVAGTLTQAGAAYNKLTDAQKTNFAVSLGGARTAETVIALLKEQPKILEATAKAYESGGKSAQLASDEQKTFTGQLKQIGSAAKDMAADLGKSGLLDFFGLLLAAIKPLVQGLDDVLKLTDKLSVPKGIPGVGGLGLGDAAGAAGLYFGVRAIRNRDKGSVIAPTGAGSFGPGGPGAVVGEAEAAGAAGVVGRRSGNAAGVARAEAQAAELRLSQQRLSIYQSLGLAEKKLTEETVAEAESSQALSSTLKGLIATTNEAAASVGRLGIAARTGGAAGGAGSIIAGQAGKDSGIIVGGAQAGLLSRGLAGARSFLTPASVGAGIGAAVGIPILIDSISSDIAKTREILKTKEEAANSAAAGLGLNSTDPAVLRAAAHDEDTAAQTAAISSGGLLGTIENFFSGGNSGQINEARQVAQINNDLATKIQTITDDQAAKGQYQLDVSSTDALDNSLQAIQKAGAGTTDQMKALQRAMDLLTQSSTGATTAVLSQGQQQIAAVVSAAASKKAVISAQDFFQQQYKDQSDNEAGASGATRQGYADAAAHDKTTADQLKHLDQGTLSSVTSDFVSGYLSQHQQFNAKDPKQSKDLGQNLLKSLRADPEFAGLGKDAQGILVSSIKASILQSLGTQPQTVAATQAAIVDTFNHQVATGQAASQQLGAAYDAGQAPGQKANDPNQPSGQLIAAQDYLKSVTKARDQAKNSKTKVTPSEMADMNTQVYNAQIAFGQAQEQNAQNVIAIDQSFLALNDKVGRELVDLQKSQEAAAKLTGQAKQVADAQNRQKLAQLQQDQAAQIGSDLTVGTTGTLNKDGTISQTGNYSYDPRATVTNDVNQANADRYSLYVLGAQERAAKGFKGYSTAYNDLYKKVVQEDQQTAEDYVSQVNANLAAAADPASAIDQANTQISQAINTMKLYAQGSPQWAAAQQNLKAGYVALVKGQADDAKNIFLLGHDATDPVQQAAAAVLAANTQLAGDQARGASPDTIHGDTVAKQAADQAKQKAAEDQWLSDNQTNYDLHRISFTTYLRNLESRDALLKAERAGLSKTSDGYRQLTDEINTTEQSILQATSQLQGQFNLGDIKVPTVYEVRRQVASTQAGVGFTDARVTSITINGIGSTQEVVQIVKAQLGTSATVTRAPATVKKA